MSLESLLTLVEKLRKRIDVHGPALRKNEWLTRYTLIDPLLRELGWDTENPDLVIPEYKEGGGSADYALFNGDKPLVIVEAKSLDTSLRDEKVLTQGLAYCQKQGTRYLSVTDGRRWEIYETHKLASIDEKRIVQFDLKSQSTAEACLKALTLWGLRESGHVAPEQIPVVGPTHKKPTPPEPSPPSPPLLPTKKWQSLSRLNPKTGALPPVEIQFPDNSVLSVKAWNSLLVEVVRWLIKDNYLTRSHCPILSKPKGATHCAVHTEPIHLSDKPFTLPVEIQSFSVETSLNVGDVVIAARNVIKSVGQKPTQFKVRFSPP